MTNIIAEMEVFYREKNGCTTIFRFGLTLNAINFVTLTSRTVIVEFQFKNTTSYFLGFSVGGSKHQNGTICNKFRENKRREVISLIEGESKTATPSQFTNKMTRDVDNTSFHTSNGNNFPVDRDTMHNVFRELKKKKKKKKKKNLGLINDALQIVMIDTDIIDEKDPNK